MKIRNMVLDDYDALYRLWQSCSGMGLNDRDDSREGIGRFLSRNPNTCFVVEENGVLIGAIMAGQDGRRGYIYHTAVSPQRQREGIGGRLVETALASLKQEGIGKVALVVFDHNRKGNRFWEKQGFTIREDIVYRNRALVEMVRYDT